MTATDQAAVVELRARLQAKIRAGHCLDDSEDGDVNFCGNCDWCIHILAERALATQPATSQEGESIGTVHITDEHNAALRAALLASSDEVATPTPPTLSEDLQKLSDQLDDVDESIRNGASACSVMLGATQSQWLRQAIDLTYPGAIFEELRAACEAYVAAYDEGTGTIHVNKQIRAALARAQVKAS